MTIEDLIIPTIQDEKIIVISDTHIGSIYENFDYLNQVYEYAIKHNIKTILHTGDLIQSTARNVSKKYRNEYNQICHVVEDYPQDTSIINYFSLGNHDYHTLKKDPIYLETLQTRKDFQILGFKRNYIDWQGNTVGLIHETRKYRIEIPKLKTLYDFFGHSHKFHNHKGHRILVPTLSDDLKFDSLPGFLVVSLQGEITTLEHIEFSPQITEPKLILMKETTYHKSNNIE